MSITQLIEKLEAARETFICASMLANMERSPYADKISDVLILINEANQGCFDSVESRVLVNSAIKLLNDPAFKMALVNTRDFINNF